MATTAVIKGIVAIVIFVILLILILVPLGLSYLEYYEFGFPQRRSTGVVYTTYVFAMGRHFIGPDYKFKTFQADAHLVDLKKVTVFTSDRLEVKLSVHFQYFLRLDELPLLHSQFDVYYKNVMKSSAVDALKQAATVFSTREMFSARQEVESTLFKAVKERLGGTCCPSYYNNCTTSTGNDTVCDDCIPRNTCNDTDKGLFADVKYFQLGETEIPSDVSERLLRALTLQEDAEKEKLIQEAQVVRKHTDYLVEQIKNEAFIISENATAQSQLIRTVAQANYTSVIEKARKGGLDVLFKDLGITKQEHKNSIDYLRTLRGIDNVHITIDFQQRIVGGFN